ncbi:hypothetical protein BU15DRAFT_80376 [Melanogaster broomeanus]|nr:hypothetical protein BU15DRAFT_80376 [Melanogaster broomeanus]
MTSSSSEESSGMLRLHSASPDPLSTMSLLVSQPSHSSGVQTGICPFTFTAPFVRRDEGKALTSEDIFEASRRLGQVYEMEGTSTDPGEQHQHRPPSSVTSDEAGYEADRDECRSALENLATFGGRLRAMSLQADTRHRKRSLPTRHSLDARTTREKPCFVASDRYQAAQTRDSFTRCNDRSLRGVDSESPERHGDQADGNEPSAMLTDPAAPTAETVPCLFQVDTRQRKPGTHSLDATTIAYEVSNSGSPERCGDQADGDDLSGMLVDPAAPSGRKRAWSLQVDVRPRKRVVLRRHSLDATRTVDDEPESLEVPDDPADGDEHHMALASLTSLSGRARAVSLQVDTRKRKRVLPTRHSFGATTQSTDYNVSLELQDDRMTPPDRLTLKPTIPEGSPPPIAFLPPSVVSEVGLNLVALDSNVEHTGTFDPAGVTAEDALSSLRWKSSMDPAEMPPARL